MPSLIECPANADGIKIPLRGVEPAPTNHGLCSLYYTLAVEDANLAQSLAQWNYHAAAGDVLLLTARSKYAPFIKAYQWARRRLPVNYTHVVVVVDRFVVVDAMPGVGVTFRKWSDIEDSYDIAACRVARHQAVASDSAMSRKVYERALYYFNQPYKLTALMHDTVKDQSGLVCSQFVGILFRDLNVDVSGYCATKTLPVDIDVFTKKASRWRQFPMVEYGLYSRCPAPPHGHPYWAQLRTSLPITLSEEEQAEARRIADEWTATFAASGTEDFDGLLARTDTLAAEGTAFEKEFLETYLGSIQDSYEASRAGTLFEDEMLKMTEWALRQPPEELRTSGLLSLRGSLLPVGEQPSNGAALLQLWRSHFLNALDRPAKFFHEEDRSKYRHRARDVFLEIVRLTKQATQNQIAGYKTLLGHMQTVGHRGVLNTDYITGLRDRAKQLLDAGQFLADESEADLQARIDSYPEVHRALLAWARGQMDRNLVRDAAAALAAINEIEFDRLMWSTVSVPILGKLIEVSNQILTRSAHSESTPH